MMLLEMLRMKTFGFHSVAVSDVTGFVLRGFILRQKAADVIAGVRHPGRRQSFGVSASERDSPKVCAPGELDFAWDVREAASAMPEADDLNLFVLAFQPVDDAI